MNQSSVPKWLSATGLDNRKDERDWAQRRRGRTQINSGRGWYAKGDTKDEILLTDTKQTNKKSYQLSRENWLRVCAWARREHRVPCVKISFMERERTVEVAVIPADFLEELLDGS